MTELFALALLAAFVFWLVRPRPRRADPAGEREPIDHKELHAAEREVQELDLHQRPEDGFDGDDWGPGASRGTRR